MKNRLLLVNTLVTVKTKQLNWRQFLYFGASLRIMPAHLIGNLSGKDYLEKYQFEFIPGSGPYIIDPNEIKKGQSLIMYEEEVTTGQKMQNKMSVNSILIISNSRSLMIEELNSKNLKKVNSI